MSACTRAVSLAATLLPLLLLLPTAASSGHNPHPHPKVYYPRPITDYQTITTPAGVSIRYKAPGKEGVCETTPGVDSYSGYIDLAPNVHVFFWFCESRRDPANDDLTLWSPCAHAISGSTAVRAAIVSWACSKSSGPCRVNENLTTFINPYSFNNVSNLLFLSQPVGVGFSNQGEAKGDFSSYAGIFLNASQHDPNSTWPLVHPMNRGEITTTEAAARPAWHILQAFLYALPQFRNNDARAPKRFNLWTESYGGHYGPAFFRHFQEQNALIQNGTQEGYELHFNSLGIINGMLDYRIQVEHYPGFALHNTYGVQAYNETVYQFARFATHMSDGCHALIGRCTDAARDYPGAFVHGRVTLTADADPAIATICSEAVNLCRNAVEFLYRSYSNRSDYDIRHPSDDPTPESYFEDYLNQAHIQHAIGVSTNYTYLSSAVYYAFQATGDWIYVKFLRELEEIIDSGVREALIYDYICNWFGGQAASLQVKHKARKEFRAAGYQPFMWGTYQAGEVREHGNHSFTRMYESGHEVPYYQPGPALALFERAISGLDIAQGIVPVTANLTSTGPVNSTRTFTAPPLPPTNTAALEAYAKALIASYVAEDLAPEPTAP